MCYDISKGSVIMLEFIEKFCIDSLENYYNTGEVQFLDNVDDNVVWYGPMEGQIIVGKDKLIEFFKRENRTLRFNVEDLAVKLFPMKADAFGFLAEYTLYAYHPDGKVSKFNRHMLVLSKRKKLPDGTYAWKSPLIHLSDVTKRNGKRQDRKYLIDEDERSLVDILMTQRKSVKKILLSGVGNSNYYVSEDAIIYVEGGKGVQCYVHTLDETFLVTQLLKDVEKKLPSYYYRCHASYIVNLRRVKKIGNYKLTLDTGEEIPIPAKKYAKVKADINEWMNTDEPDIL